jgi:GAF domain-containing protein
MAVMALPKHSPLFDFLNSRPRNPLPPGRLGAYIFMVGVIGAALLVLALSRIPLAEPVLLFSLYLMIFITEWVPIKLHSTPLEGSSLSVSAAFAFGALLILGPAGSIVVNTGSAVAYCLKEKRPFYKRLFTTATLISASAVSGLIYVVAGGKSPIGLELSSVIAAGLAAGAYFLANSALISGAISLQTGRPFCSVLATWQWLFLQMLTSLAVGSVMALALGAGFGLAAYLVASLLLVLPWYSTYFYVQKSRQVAEQTERLKTANAGLKEANRELDLRLEELRTLHNIGLSLNSARDLPTILQEILASAVRLTGADASAIFLYDDGGKRASIAGQVGLSEQYIRASEMALNGSAVRAVREGHAIVMDRKNDVPAMLSGAALGEGIRHAACLPLKLNGAIVGGLDVDFKSEHIFGEVELGLLRTLAEHAAVAIQNARLVQQVHESYLSTIQALAATVEAKDPYTRGHSEFVRKLAIATGLQLGLSARQLELLNIASLFHDIGKIGITELILNKPGGLNDEEWPIMRQHPIIGERILGQVPALGVIPAIVRHHHERFDGRGYPDAICARDDLLAAIIGVCDTFQAMTSDRPYRKAYTCNQALDEIRRGSGTQFVPEVVDAFMVAIERQDSIQPQGSGFDLNLLLHDQARAGESSPRRSGSSFPRLSESME